MRTRIVMAAAVLMAAVACAPSGSQPSTEIPKLAGAWEEALNSGDIEALTSLYTEDARLMPPGAGVMTGREAVRELFTGMIEAGVTIDLETLEAVEAGDIGYHVGTYAVRSPEGAVMERGKFVEVRRRTPAGWQIAEDIWNRDAAADGTETWMITHDVEDGELWLAAWQGEPGRREMFAEHGVPAVRVFQSPDDPDKVGLVVDVSDPEAFRAFLASPEGAQAKSEDGVVDDTIRVLIEAD